jgi:hypothetical protein
VVEGFANAAGEMPARDASVGAPARPLTAGDTGRVRLARWAWPAALAVAAVVLFLCYLRLSRTVQNGSDGADQALQAWDMLHGNWLLRGWTVGDVSYYTTELPEYIVVELIRGLGPDVIHVAAAVTYTLLVLLAAVAAKGRATGREGMVRALIASGILLAPQLDHGIALLIQQPDHIGTQVPLLVIFIVLDRAQRSPGGTTPPVPLVRGRWYIPAAIAVMLTWVTVADRVAVFDAALPLVAVCGLRAFWALVHDRKPLASLWFEVSLIAAGIVSFGASVLVVSAIQHLGGYTPLPLITTRASARDIPPHLMLTIKGILTLYGANFGGLSPGVAVAMAVVHLAGLALALWGVGRAFRRFFSTSDLIVPVLATGIVINLAAYIFSVRPVTWFDTREILAVLPFGAVLAGRLLAEPLARARLVPVLAGVLAGYALALGYGVAQPSAAADGEYPVVGWLEAHHLSTGLGTYTESNLITLDSGGRVAVRTVSWWPSGAVPRAYESEASWYDPRLSYANFVVVNLADSHGISAIPRRDILALAGPPAHTYHYKTFIIMVWNHNLLADLGTPPSPFPGNLLNPATSAPTTPASVHQPH